MWLTDRQNDLPQKSRSRVQKERYGTKQVCPNLRVPVCGHALHACACVCVCVCHCARARRRPPGGCPAHSLVGAAARTPDWESRAQVSGQQLSTPLGTCQIGLLWAEPVKHLQVSAVIYWKKTGDVFPSGKVSLSACKLQGLLGRPVSGRGRAARNPRVRASVLTVAEPRAEAGTAGPSWHQPPAQPFARSDGPTAGAGVVRSPRMAAPGDRVAGGGEEHRHGVLHPYKGWGHDYLFPDGATVSVIGPCPPSPLRSPLRP